jgi:hypothetical protein
MVIYRLDSLTECSIQGLKYRRERSFQQERQAHLFKEKNKWTNW